MRSLSFCLPLVAALAAGCDPPPAQLLAPRQAGNRALDEDYRVAPSSGLGKQAQAITVGDGPNGEQILYVNFDGASITRIMNVNNADDSAQNRSWIPDTVPEMGQVAIPAFDASKYLPTPTSTTAQQAKDFLINQVKTWYEPFNVLVVTSRPASGRYTMMMVGGAVTSVLMTPGGAVGVAPLDCGNDSQINIGFAFANSVAQPAPTTDQERQVALFLLAQTIAHEAGHSFGLEHVVAGASNNDIMVPAIDPTVTGFLDTNSTLSKTPSTCPPSANTENTHLRLMNNLGPAPTGPSVPRPNVAFLAPKNGDTVPTSFTVAVSASQPAGAGGSISKVEVVQSGVTLLSMTSPPYRGTLNTSGAEGMFTLTAVAYNSLGGKASTQTTFTVQNGAVQPTPGCLVATDCQAGETCSGGMCVLGCIPACETGQICQDGNCVPDPGLVDMSMPNTTSVPVGMSCLDSSECGTGGVCATNNGKKFCTRSCDPATKDACPSSYECAAVAGDHYCSPASSGCSAAGPSSRIPSPGPLALLLFAFAFLRRRSRPSAT